MSDSTEHRVRTNPERKFNMVFNKIFRLRFLVLVLLAACLWALYYFVLRDPYGSIGGDWVHQDDYLVPGRDSPIRLDVFYESLCPDSKSFFLNHLLPTVNKMSSLLSVNLVPYGRATTIYRQGAGNIRKAEDVDFTCQHGEPECFGNRVHACVIARSHQNQVLAVNVTSCLFEDYFQSSNSEKCCQKFGLDWNDVKTCANGVEGREYLAGYGVRTDEHLPIDFIPSIAVNKRLGNKRFQGRLLKDFSGELCKLLKRVGHDELLST